LKLNCLIVDDEFLARQLLEGYVKKVPFLEIVALCERAVDAMQILQTNKVDLIFLDVNMPELNGISLIKALKQKPEIIVTTAYSEYALEGYQLDVIEYLLKPIYFDRFLQAVNKAKDQIDLKLKAKQAGAFGLEGSSFFIKTGSQKMVKIQLSDIIYIESLHEYVRIHLKNENHTIYHSLKSMLDILPEDQFVQVHRSFIINFSSVRSVEGNTVKVGEAEVSIGKNFREEFIRRIKSKSLGGIPGKTNG
jgi:DNA-binding LytR/AlgR family response regulator